MDYNIEHLQQIAKTRWFRSNEIYQILNSITTTNLKILIVDKIPFQPQTGSIFIINGSGIKQKWKHDGYNYIPRKKGTGFREDVEKLKIGGSQVIICYYSYIMNNQLQNDNETTIQLNRRIYRLIDIKDESKNYYLIHYFKDNKDSSSTTLSISESNDEQLSRQFNSNLFYQQKEETKKDCDEIITQQDIIQSQQNDDKVLLLNENNNNNELEMQDFFLNNIDQMFDKDQDNQFSNNNFFCQDNNHHDIINSNLNCQSIALNQNQQMNGKTHCNNMNEEHQQNQIINNNNNKEFSNNFLQSRAEIIKSNNNNYEMNNNINNNLAGKNPFLEQKNSEAQSHIDLLSRIIELEERLQQLEFQRKSSYNDFSEEKKSNNKIKITEYSPEWDSCQGGSKIVLCFMPAFELKADAISQLNIHFGDVPAQAHCVQPGVLKAQIPPHNKGLVKLSIYYHNERIDDPMDKPSFFEYKKNQNNKKKKSSKNFLDDENGLYMSELKVRIVDKLNNFQSFIQSQNIQSQNINNPQQEQSEGDQTTKTQSVIPPQQINEISQIIDKVKIDFDNLNQDTYKIMLEKLLQYAEKILTHEQIKKWFDLLDEFGFGLIHYLSILGYDQIIQLMIKYKCDLSLNSQEHVSPIEIAIAMNQEKVVELLLKCQVISVQDLEKYQLNNCQSKNDEKDMNQLNVRAIYKNRNVLEMFIREVTLHDSINSNSLADQFSWNDQDEQEDHNYLNLDEIYGEDWSNDLNLFDAEAEEDKDQDGQDQLKKPSQAQKAKEGHKYLRKYDKKKSYYSNQKKVLEVDINKKGDIYQSADNQNHIKLIQKNVRMWLLRRQYQDIKYATRILQHHLRQKLLAKKQLNSVCKSMIKNKVKDWLNIKY